MLPGRMKAAALEKHYRGLVSKLQIKLSASEIEALADKLKVPGSRLETREPWSQDQNLALMKLVKKVEEDRASFPVGANERILEGERVHSGRWWFFSVGANEPILEGE